MATEKKTDGELLAEKLLMKKKHAGLIMSDEEIKEAFDYCERYKSFISISKIEREAVVNTVIEAEKKGFVPFDPDWQY